MGFVFLKLDTSLFIWKGPEGPVYILLYVDDLVITGPGLAEIARMKSQLSDAFEMKYLGDLHYFLERHTALSATLCAQYVVQVRHDRLLTNLHTPEPESQALSRLRSGLQ